MLTDEQVTRIGRINAQCRHDLVKRNARLEVLVATLQLALQTLLLDEADTIDYPKDARGCVRTLRATITAYEAERAKNNATCVVLEVLLQPYEDLLLRGLQDGQ